MLSSVVNANCDSIYILGKLNKQIKELARKAHEVKHSEESRNVYLFTYVSGIHNGIQQEELMPSGKTIRAYLKEDFKNDFLPDDLYLEFYIWSKKIGTSRELYVKIMYIPDNSD